MSDEEAATETLFASAGQVMIAGEPCGWIGLISPKIQAHFDLQTPVVAAELQLHPLLESYPPQRRVSALPRFPGIERDLSIVVNESVTWSAISTASRARSPPSPSSR